jgi:hypothetical protein
MDLSTIVSKDFVFSAVPPVSTKLYLPFSVFFGVMIVAGLALLVFARGGVSEIWRRYTTPLILVGFLGFLHLGARYEQLPWIASRFFLILILTVLFAWLFALAMTMTKLVPRFKQEQAAKERFNKYLPKKKS